MRIGLLGMGTIGSGVYEIVAKRADMEIARVLDLRPIPGLGGKLTTRFEDILEDKTIDTVVEEIPVAREIVEKFRREHQDEQNA